MNKEQLSRKLKMAGHRHILMVDDEPQIISAFRLFFESFGLVVSTASGGDEALGLLAATSFDVVITDLLMPNGEGTELIAEIRRNGDALPIIVITSDDGALRLLTQFANIQVLFKPANADEILDALEHAL